MKINKIYLHFYDFSFALLIGKDDNGHIEGKDYDECWKHNLAGIKNNGVFLCAIGSARNRLLASNI